MHFTFYNKTISNIFLIGVKYDPGILSTGFVRFTQTLVGFCLPGGVLIPKPVLILLPLLRSKKVMGECVREVLDVMKESECEVCLDHKCSSDLRCANTSHVSEVKSAQTASSEALSQNPMTHFSFKKKCPSSSPLTPEPNMSQICNKNS